MALMLGQQMTAVQKLSYLHISRLKNDTTGTVKNCFKFSKFNIKYCTKGSTFHLKDEKTSNIGTLKFLSLIN